MVKMHFLVDTGVTQKVKEHLLRHAQRAEVFHFYRGGGVKDQRSVQLRIRHVRMAASVKNTVKSAV